MDLKIMETTPDEKLKGRTGHAGGGARYGKYHSSAIALKPWLLEQIAMNKSGIINVNSKLLREAMGGTFVNKSPTSVYWALKYILFLEGIWVGTGTSTDEKDPELLTFRIATKDDQLPASLTKYLPKNKGEQVDENKSVSESEVES